ncbi:MAG TPA: Sec-independent protein translocase protein TatB [Pseudolabrys sp.]|jgi:sec-independent protein translocase protein TatB
MFGLGWGEVVVIGIVALIAIGPKELPTVLRTLGQWMGKVRRMANEFQGQFQEALREAEFADIKKHADDISSSVNEFSNIDPLADVQKDVEREFAETPVLEGTPAETTDAPAGTPTDGASLPAAVLPTIDVPLPDAPPALTSADFMPPEPPTPVEPAPVKKAGSGA